MNKVSAAAFFLVLVFIFVAGYLVFTNIQGELQSARLILPREEEEEGELVPTLVTEPSADVTHTPIPSPTTVDPETPTTEPVVKTVVAVDIQPTIHVRTPTPTPTLEPTPTQSWLPSTSPTPEQAGTVVPGSTPSPTLSGRYSFHLDGGVVHDLDSPCTGQYIRGMVRDRQGQPLEGIRIRAYDLWGNEAFTRSKGGPDAGKWDVVLGSTENIWHVVILNDAGDEISPVAVVPHHQEGPFKDACAHNVDWRRSW